MREGKRVRLILEQVPTGVIVAMMEWCKAGLNPGESKSCTNCPLKKKAMGCREHLQYHGPKVIKARGSMPSAGKE
jgi:hypothetical protein